MLYQRAHVRRGDIDVTSKRSRSRKPHPDRDARLEALIARLGRRLSDDEFERATIALLSVMRSMARGALLVRAGTAVPEGFHVVQLGDRSSLLVRAARDAQRLRKRLARSVVFAPRKRGAR